MSWILNPRLWVIAFVVFLLVARPMTAAHLVHRGEHALTNAGDSLTTFVDHI